MTESAKNIWEAAYVRNIGKLIGICFRYTRNRPLSEDLAHEAFLKAIERSATFRGLGSFDAWLRKIAVNHVLQHIRDQKRIDGSNILLHALSVQEEMEDLTARDSVTTHYEISEQEVLDAINRLPEHHRLVFNLYVIDHFTHRRIGEALGISAGTSKSHLARARQKLRAYLDEKIVLKKSQSRYLIFFFPPGSFIRKCCKSISNLELSPATIRPLHIIDHGGVYGFIQSISAAKSMMYAGSLVIFATSIITAYSLINEQSSDSMTISEMASINVVASSSYELSFPQKTNSKKIDSTAATVAATSVIANKNTTVMKITKTDTLAALAIATSLFLDSSAQTRNSMDTLSDRKFEYVTPAPYKMVYDTLQSSPSGDNQKNFPQYGTFSSKKLFWSDKNKQVYLKGKSRVDFGNNHFDSVGEVNFLGTVHLLSVNGMAVKPGSTVELEKRQYRLTMLTRDEAIAKYGQQGEQGAVEIF